MPHSFCRTLSLLALFGGSLVAGAAPAQSAGAPVKCQPVGIAEYCFPGGSFHDLVPLDRLEEQFNKKARTLKAERNGPSKLPAARRDELQEMWLTALMTAFDYADNHSIKLSTDGAISPSEGSGSVQRPSAPLANGTLFRLTFAEDDEGRFRLSRSIQIHVDRTLRTILGSRNQLPAELQALALTLPFLSGALPKERGYVALSDLFALPGLNKFATEYERESRKSGTNLLGIFGFEVVLALEAAFEERIRDRNRTLEHAIHFYSTDADPASTTKSPQVLFTGELMLPDATVAALSDTELMLLMFHEAMHLARPNLFMLLSSADLVQRERFPDLDTARAAPFLANFLGQDARGPRANCPLDIVHDDELATDYYVFHLFRRKPDLARAYNAFLKRLHAEFDPGHVSPMSYRVRLGDHMIDYLEDGAWKSRDSDLENRLFWQSMVSTLVTRGFSYLAGEKIRMEHILEEMSKHPELRHDVLMLRTFIDYYKNNARLTDDALPNTDPNLSCRDIAIMMRSSR